MLIIQTQSELFLRLVSQVAGFVERKSVMPILSNLNLKKDGMSITLTACDVTSQISATSDIGVGFEETSFTVNAKDLQNILKTLKQGSEVSIYFDDNSLLVKSGKAKFKLPTMPSSEYPFITASDQCSGSITLTQKELKDALNNVVYSAAINDTRYFLNGVLFHLNDGKFNAVATDGHRLAMSTVQNESAKGDIRIIVPNKTTGELTRQLADSNDPVAIRIHETFAIFEYANVQILSKLIDGKFPDYNRVIPKTFAHELTINRAQFQRSSTAASLFCNEKFQGVLMSFESNELKLKTAVSSENNSEDSIDIEYSADPVSIGINSNFLLETLGTVRDETVKLCFSDQSSSLCFKPTSNSDSLHIVMPMRC